MASAIKVEELNSVLPTPDLWGAFRVKGAAGNRLELVGWVLAVADEVAKIEIVTNGVVVASTTPHLPRPDMAEQFPDRPAAAECGFEVVIEGRGRGESLLELEAVLEDGRRTPMGQVRVLAPRRWGDTFRRR